MRINEDYTFLDWAMFLVTVAACLLALRVNDILFQVGAVALAASFFLDPRRRRGPVVRD